MQPTALDALPLICPCCRSAEGCATLTLAQCLVEEQGEIIEGFLRCTAPACGQRFPIIAGVPVVLRDLAAWWSKDGEEVAPLLRNSHPLTDFLQGLDSASERHVARLRRLSTWLQTHFGESDPLVTAYWSRLGEVAFGSSPSGGVLLDLGCATGRFTFEGTRHHRFAVGIDLDLHFVAAAAQLQRRGAIEFSRMRSLRSWERVRYTIPAAANTLFLVADALDPPFIAESFDQVVALNLIDNIRYPLILLGQMDALLKPSGSLLLTSPFTWDAASCDPAEWLESSETPPEKILLEILEGTIMGEMGLHYRLEQVIDRLDWVVPQQDRMRVIYSVFALLARRQAAFVEEA